MATNAPRRGECPHCGRVLQVLNERHAVPTMAQHNYRTPALPGKPKRSGVFMPCPGTGRRCKPGTERYK